MTKNEKAVLLKKTKEWFREVVAKNHIENTKKLQDISEFNVNPFLATYLANFLTGNSDPISISRALIYPRVLGTSITTSFGQNMQNFTKDVLSAYGSTTSGIDIEFFDNIDQKKRFCQLKAGPNILNKDDVETIGNHFKNVINLGRTNGVKYNSSDFLVGVIYGNPEDLSGHFRRITSQYNYDVSIGENFWHRLTGEPKFYYELVKVISQVANESNYSKELENIISELAKSEEIIKLSKLR
jgi:hypothetical protein